LIVSISDSDGTVRNSPQSITVTDSHATTTQPNIAQTKDPNGGTQGSIDLSNISFGVDTTLAYSVNNDNSGGTLTVSDGLYAQSVALLGQYMASSFVMASDGHGGTLITDPASNQQALLTPPHA
jgi:hypothetical protein